MKRKIALFLAFILAFATIGCGNAEPQVSEEELAEASAKEAYLLLEEAKESLYEMYHFESYVKQKGTFWENMQLMLISVGSDMSDYDKQSYIKKCIVEEVEAYGNEDPEEYYQAFCDHLDEVNEKATSKISLRTAFFCESYWWQSAKLMFENNGTHESVNEKLIEAKSKIALSSKSEFFTDLSNLYTHLCDMESEIYDISKKDFDEKMESYIGDVNIVYDKLSFVYSE